MEWALDGVKERYVVLDKTHWNSFYSSMRELLGDATNTILKKIGEDFGRTVFSIVREKYGADRKTALLFILQNLEKLGWGAFWNMKIEESAGKITVELHNPSEAYNKGNPSCYHITGILKGLAAGILEGHVIVRETECVAKGDKVCKFVIGSKEVVPALYTEETMGKLAEILKELKKTIKSSIELVATSDGIPIISLGLPEELDPELWGTIVSFLLAGAETGAAMIGNGDLKEIVVNANEGLIIASQCTEKIILIAVVGPDTSPGLAGLALKKAKEKIAALLK